MHLIHGGPAVHGRQLSRLLFRGAIAMSLAIGILAAPSPARANSFRPLTPVQWAYTDSRTPTTSHIDENRDAPIGSWRDADGKHHKSRSYFTFDLSTLRDAEITWAFAYVTEVAVEDCTKDRTWEVWRTEPITSSATWNQPPAELSKIATVGGSNCPGQDIQVAALTDLVKDALAHGQTRITIEVRVPADREGNLHLGRTIAHDVVLSASVSSAPTTPVGLTINQQACGAQPILLAPGILLLSGEFDDPDLAYPNDEVYGVAYFAVWPVDNPSARVEYQQYANGDGSGLVVAAMTLSPYSFQDGVEYAWAMSSDDPTDQSPQSPWSSECHFTVDWHGPAQAPTVTSSDYPDQGGYHGGVGIPGTFTFSANGDADVAGFRWHVYTSQGSEEDQYVAADHPGGTATVVYTPAFSGVNTMSVTSMDRAGNDSPTASYQFAVLDTSPSIVDETPDAWAGDTHTLTFSSALPGVVSYTYKIDDGAAVTLPAEADGTASFSATPTAQGIYVSVYATNAAGQRGGTSTRYFVADDLPRVASPDYSPDITGAPVGTHTTFTFAPHMHGVTTYVYQFDGGEEQTVAAGADGRATISYVPTTTWFLLRVRSLTADGSSSLVTANGYYATSISPLVSSTDYPAWSESGAPGVAGTFRFQPRGVGVTSYTYRFGVSEALTVAAGADGTATISWTPTRWGFVSLTVSSLGSDGTVSDLAYYSFSVAGLRPALSSVTCPYAASVAVGTACDFHVTNRLPGAVEFVYTIDDGPQQTVAVGPDGTATFVWTAEGDGHYRTISVWSRTAAGLESANQASLVWVG